MAIKDIDDRMRQADGMPLGGRLMKGGPSPEPGEPGIELNYWRFKPGTDSEARNDSLEDHFRQHYGNEPMSIPIMLVGESADSAFTYWNEDYEDGTLFTRCDGSLRVKQRGNDGKYARGLTCLKKQGKQCYCRPVGRLHFRLPAMEASTGLLMRYTMYTGSYDDIRKISAFLRTVESLYVSASVPLNLIPMLLRRVKQGEYWNVELMLDPDFLLNWKSAPIQPRPVMESDEPDENGETTYAGGYAPYMTALFTRYIPDATFRSFCNIHGMTVPLFVQQHHYLDGVKQMVVEWLVEEQRWLNLWDVHVVKLAGEGNSHLYTFDAGFTLLRAYSRKPFKDAGYLRDNDWQEDGLSLQWEIPIRAKIDQSMRGDFSITEVEPLLP